MQRNKWLLAFVLLAGGLLLGGCGSDNPTHPIVGGTSVVPPPPLPPPPSIANIDLEVLGVAAFSGNDGNFFQIEFRMTESAGVGAHINFARLEVFRATGELEERKEIGAGKFILGVDDNRLEGNTSETATATFLFRATIKKGRTLRYTMGFTDDGGNDHELVKEFIFS
jgi:hypothetical protein